MDRGPIHPRKLEFRGLLSELHRSEALVCGISPPFGRLSPRVGQVAHVLLTRAPLYRGRSPFSYDLHVLGAPLTFALSQDQTLLENSASLQTRVRRPRCSSKSRCPSSSGLFARQLPSRLRTPRYSTKSSSRSNRCSMVAHRTSFHDQVFKDRGALSPRAPLAKLLSPPSIRALCFEPNGA
jgi:hypothetical protein